METSTLVSTVEVGDRSFNIYDSSLIYPTSHSYEGNINELVNTLVIPSSRYYYLNRNGERIPYLALASEEQFSRDLAAWIDQYKIYPTIYGDIFVNPSDYSSVDLTNIAMGKVILNPTYIQLRRFVDMLRELNQLEGEEKFALRATIEFSRIFFTNPFNPSADFIKASQIANSKNRIEIEQYLKDRDIITFNVDDIINLDSWDIFFYLTRFYGPPKRGDLNLVSIIQKYRRKNMNDLTERIIGNFNLGTYRRFQKEFDALFDHFNSNPLSTHYEKMGATNRERFKNSFWDYLNLFGRPSNLPILTLNTIHSLKTNSEKEITRFLSDYTDQEIIELAGTTAISDMRTRTEFIETVTKYLINNTFFLLTPNEASLCRNEKSAIFLEEFAEFDHFFVGKGSLANGLDCYDISELFDYFESSKTADGIYFFKDPLHAQVEFNVDDLEDLRKAVMLGRGNTPIDNTIVERLQKYIDQARLQLNSVFKQVQLFRSFAQENDENKQLIRDLWTSYFRMGMYMRQWKGPGDPYPILKEQTGSSTEGLAPEFVSKNLTDENLTFLSLIRKLPSNLEETFWKLGMFLHTNGKVNSLDLIIQTRYDGVMAGTWCIRMASAPWAYTGAYYFKLILDEDIPGIDLTKEVKFIY